jgi:hypothetical protein
MTAVLEVAIGLGFVYLIFSLVASTIVEWPSAVGDRRAAFLKLALTRSLGPALTAQLLKHEVIRGIAAEAKPSWWGSLPKPNYLPPRAVALALGDIARQPNANPSLVKLMNALKSELAVAGNQAIAIDGEVLFRIERWFTEQMNRTTAGYKRWTQLWTIALALVLTIAFDIDAGRVTNHLLSNAAVRSALAATASNEVAKQTLAEIQPTAATLAALPVGWTRPVSEAIGNGGPSTFATFAGWAISIIAIGLGAPFWFDLLNRLVSLRQTGPKPADKTFEG